MKSFSAVGRLAACLAATLLFAAPGHAWEWGIGKRITGSGVSKTETRAVSDFTGIGLAVAANVEIRQGAGEALTITGDDNIVALVETVVENGSLKIRWTEKNVSTSYKNLKIVIDAKTIEKLSVAGSGEVHMASLKTSKLKTSIAGSGDVNIASLSADDVDSSISGSGSFTAGGKTNTLHASIAGSGDLKAAKLEASEVKVSIAGSGDATVWAKNKLKISVAGSGDVKYYGNPEISKSVAGSGSARKMGDAP
ncbi:MAG: DUF2807 domain-containing protein [Betaproteobacteria bacterium]|nr:DUF2807 domain-containing protein [Betaproteobacteria bacterium]